MCLGLCQLGLMKLLRWLIKCFLGSNSAELNEFSPLKCLGKYAKTVLEQACDGVCGHEGESCCFSLAIPY